MEILRRGLGAVREGGRRCVNRSRSCFCRLTRRRAADDRSSSGSTARHAIRVGGVRNGERTIRCFVAIRGKEKAAVVLVIHENKGLTDWARGVADQIAEAGYIAVAPDLLSGLGPGGGKRATSRSVNPPPRPCTRGRRAGALRSRRRRRLRAEDPRRERQACGSRLLLGRGAVVPLAAKRADLKAAFVFYGVSPATKEDARTGLMPRSTGSTPATTRASPPRSRHRGL